MCLLMLVAAFSGCLLRDSDPGSDERSLVSATESEPTATPLPPGGLVDTQPSSGWTEGVFGVTDDGAATYDVPLWVPDGRHGMEPTLSLHYSSRSGNGLLGVGWSLTGLSSIRPCPRTIAQDGERAPVLFSDADVYCLDGSRLRPVGPATGGEREYRTEQNPFSRIVSHGAGAVPDYFTVHAKGGRILTFGGDQNATVSQSRMFGFTTEEPSLARWPDPATTRWALRSIEDRNGNVINFEYNHVENANDLWSVEMRPKRITYSPDRSIDFVYETRTDTIDEFQAGGLLGGVHNRLTKRLLSIRMSGGDELLREYRLGYDPDSTSITGRSRLQSVTDCDPMGTCLLPVQFEWSNGSYGFQVIDTTVSDAGGFPLPGYTFQTGDINGDGADDLVYGDVNNEWRLRISNKVTDFGPAQPAGIPRARDRFYRPRVRSVDYDRGGLMDLLVEVNAEDAAHPDRTRFALFHATGSTFQRHAPELDDVPMGEIGASAGVYAGYFADLDGNGLTDYLAPSLGDGSSLTWRYSPNPALDSGMQPSDLKTPYTDDLISPIRVADTNGDGLNEVIVRNPETDAYQRIGYVDGQLETSTAGLNLPSTGCRRMRISETSTLPTSMATGSRTRSTPSAV